MVQVLMEAVPLFPTEGLYIAENNTASLDSPHLSSFSANTFCPCHSAGTSCLSVVAPSSELPWVFSIDTETPTRPKESL